MVNARVLMLAGATLCCAVAIGVSLQPELLSNVLGTKHVSPQDQVTASQDGAARSANLPAEPELPLVLENITLTAAPQESVLTPNDIAAAVAACDMTVDAEVQANAMVALSVGATCSPHQTVTVHHSGMMFKVALDHDGRAEIILPALNKRGVFLVEVEAGQSKSVQAPVEGLDRFNRIVLQWGGASGFELHAREAGANYGEPGHVWSGSDLPSAGSVYRLGDSSLISPLMAEVYSLPTTQETSGTVQMTVEAEVTAQNCNRAISAQTLDLRAGKLRSRDLVLNMPACDAAGDFLVLNNLVETLTIAAN